MDGTREFLQAKTHVWNHVFNFINSMSLKCAVELGLPDIIHRHGKPMTVDELTAALLITPQKSCCIHRLMRLLAHSGFFIYDREQQTYSLTSASKILLKDNPFSVAPFLLAMLDPVLINPWQRLSEWFKRVDGPTTPFHLTKGLPFWDYAGHDPRVNSFFNEAMASDSRLITSALLSQCRGVFEGLNSLVDVGGGTGTVALGVAGAFPNVDCTVLDLQHVVAGLEGGKNLKYVAGDMFEAVPPADAVLLKWILHDWDDERCVKILKRCKEAISRNCKTGKLIVIDMVLKSKAEDEEDFESGETQLFFDVLMLALISGKERTEEEWARLFLRAGFGSYKIVSTLGLRSLIEVYP